MPYQTAATFLQAASASFRDGAAGSLTALRNAGNRFIVQRKIRIALARLDDHMLKDLGLARADIDRLSRGTVADLCGGGGPRT